jgi:hypothetical protein
VLLELAMRNTVAFLEHSRRREKRGQGVYRVRGYDSLLPLTKDDNSSNNGTSSEAMQVEEEQQPRTSGIATTTTTTSAAKKPNVSTTTTVKAGTLPMDPMLCEVCRCIGNLYTSTDTNGNISTIASRQYVHQWRKACLASVCDALEAKLLPLLLRLGNRNGISNSNNNNHNRSSEKSSNKKNVPTIPPEHVLATWQEWIPWFTTFIQDEPGRQLLRTQFRMKQMETTTRCGVGGGRTTTSAATKNTSGILVGCHSSCSAIGVVVELLYASVMLEQSQVKVPQCILTLCQTIRDQSIQFFHAWLQCKDARKPGQASFLLSLVSEFLEFYKSACAWILYQNDITTIAAAAAAESESGTVIMDDGYCKLKSSRISSDIVAMIRLQMEELVLDEEEALEALEKRYSK